MASLFGLTTLLGLTSDKYGTAKQRTGLSGTANQFDKLQKGFGYNLMKYPLDIGDYPRGHYMMIHINEQIKTQYSVSQRGGSTLNVPTAVEQNKSSLNSALGGSTSVVPTAVKYGGELAKAAESLVNKARESSAIVDTMVTNAVAGVNTVGNLLGLSGQSDAIKAGYENVKQQLSSDAFLRTIKRTTDTIVLYMPNSIAYDLSQSYQSPTLGGSALGALVGGASAGAKSAEGEEIANMAPFAAGYLAQNSNLFQVGFAGATGKVINPQIEVLYQSPSLRNFQFTFEMYPRSAKEAYEIQKIIAALMFHQAPEIVGANAGGGEGGFFMTPPSEFDISFYYNGQENKNIPQMTTSVLTGINVDYAPDGHWHAYELENDLSPLIGGSGMPVGIRMTLSFMETEMMTKTHYRDRMYSLTGKK